VHLGLAHLLKVLVVVGPKKVFFWSAIPCASPPPRPSILNE
jgi:hypothetical protein